MGPEGFEPPPTGLKGRCAAVTPRPRTGTSCRGIRLSQTIVSVLATTSVGESGRPDSNRRSQAPRACGLARLSHALSVPASSPCGNRTLLSALKGRYPRTDRRTGHPSRVGRVALESTSAAFQAAATPSQLPAHPTKRPGCRMTPGPGRTVEVASAGASQAQRMDGQRIRRLTGETTRSRSLTGVTGPPGKHRDLGRLGASSPLRRGRSPGPSPRLACHCRRRSRRRCSRRFETYSGRVSGRSRSGVLPGRNPTSPGPEVAMVPRPGPCSRTSVLMIPRPSRCGRVSRVGP